MRLSWYWSIKSRRFFLLLYVLFMLLLTYTLVYFHGISVVQDDYAKAAMVWEPNEPVLHAVYVYRPVASIPYSPIKFLDNLYLDFLFPTLVALFFLDMDYIQRKVNLSSSITVSSRRRHIIYNGFNVFIMSTILMTICFLMQAFFAKLLEVILQPLDQTIAYSLDNAVKILSSSLKVSMYLASLQLFAYSIGLFLFRAFNLIYLIPMIVGVSLVLLFPFNIPSSLGFINDGLSFGRPETLFIYIGVIILVSLILMFIRSHRRNEL